MIRRVIRRFEPKLPLFSPKHCLRIRGIVSCDVQCDRCVRVCPHGAVGTTSGIAIDAGACVGCGICASVCPTGALSGAGESAMLSAAHRKEGAKPIGCALSGVPSIQGGVVAPALCGVSWQGLACILIPAGDAAAGESVPVDCRGCTGCRVGRKAGAVRESLSRATRFLSACGVNVRYRVLEDASESFPETEPDGLSRRQFFCKIGSATRGEVSALLSPEQQSGSRTLARQRLWKLARNVACGDTTSHAHSHTDALHESIAPWADFSVSSACTACGICASVCPGGAWRVGTGGETRTVSFAMRECRNCGACVRSCPQGSIAPTGVLVPLPRDQTEVKHVQRATRCRRCRCAGRTTRDGLCDNCSKQSQLLAATG